MTRTLWKCPAATFLLYLAMLCDSTLAEAQIRQWSAPFDWDLARNLTDEFRYDTLEAMQSQGLLEARLPISPWTDSYWPIYAGGIAIRYMDPGFPVEGNWATYSRYILGTIGALPTPLLSPAEKYDLLVGDRNFTLTRTMARLGGNFANSQGEVATWMGFCKGWAAAALMLPRPVRSIQVTAADGRTQIEFRPSDLKALASLLWAEGIYPERFIGGKCGATEPQRDRAARPVTPVCQDTNPATWHLTVVHQLGVSKRGLIMDADPAHEVWNHPVMAYRYTYFHPRTGAVANSWEKAQALLSEYPNDPFARHRSPGTHSVVGIEMETTYVYEDFPSPSATDSDANDILKKTAYRYDLELDRKGRIIGGEWHTQIHPDFLWMPVAGARPRANAENALPPVQWNGNGPVPREWAQAARASSQYSQPLGRIVEGLFQKAAHTN